MTRTLIAAAILCIAGCRGKTSESSDPPAEPPPVEPLTSGDAAPAAPTPAAEPAISCDVESIRALRKRANAELGAGDAKKALATFARADCYFDDSTPALAEQTAWLVSDRAFALYKAGDFLGCHALADSQLAPYPGNVAAAFDDDHRVIAALAHNAALCGAQVDKLFAGFSETACPLGVEHAHGVPPALLTAPTTAACLQILPGSTDDEGMFVPGDVTWIERSGGELTRRVLGDLGGEACNINEIGFRKRDGSLQILVAGEGRDCNGGTAATGFRIIESIDPTGLTEVLSHSVSYH